MPATELATDILAIRRDVQRIEPLSRVRPHVFAEQKDELAHRLERLATRLRNSFGGTPAQLEPGSIARPNRRPVRVERRRAGQGIR